MQAAGMAPLLAFGASVVAPARTRSPALSQMTELLDEGGGRPWATAAPVTRLGEPGPAPGLPAEAGRPLERAVAATAQWPPRGGPAAGAPLLLAHARAARGATLVAAGRGPEAVAVLTEAIPALGETDLAARARVDHGRAFGQAGDPRSAAEQFALASVAFRTEYDQRAHLLASIEAAGRMPTPRRCGPRPSAYEYAGRPRHGAGPVGGRPDPPRPGACIRQHGDAGLVALTQFDHALTVAAQAAGSRGRRARTRPARTAEPLTAAQTPQQCGATAPRAQREPKSM